MDSPKITVQVSPQASKAAVETAATEESYRPMPPRTLRSKQDLRPNTWWQAFKQTKKTRIFLPVCLALLTGLLLGICMLLLFKGQAGEPVATKVPPAGNAAPNPTAQGAAELQGASLYVWQLGVFQEKNAAQKAQTDFAAKGVHASLRGDGPFALFAGVATDKAAGAKLEKRLREHKIDYYAKPYPIEGRKGMIGGLGEAGAQQATTALNGSLTLAQDVLQAAMLSGAPDTQTVQNLRTRLQASQKQLASLQKSLSQAGLAEEAKQAEQLGGQLAGAVGALTDAGHPDVQKSLTAYFVSYESLIGKLVKTQ